jgi:hypothetical protein
MGDLLVDKGIILNWMLKMCYVRMLTACLWHSSGICEHSNEPPGSIEVRNFLTSCQLLAFQESFTMLGYWNVETYYIYVRVLGTRCRPGAHFWLRQDDKTFSALCVAGCTRWAINDSLFYSHYTSLIYKGAHKNKLPHWIFSWLLFVLYITWKYTRPWFIVSLPLLHQ